MNKKFASLLVAGAMITALGTTSALAASPATDYPVCTVSSCTETGSHSHHGTTYSAHYANDGHTYHAYCGVTGCFKTGTHTVHSSGHHSGGHNGHRSSGGHH